MGAERASQRLKLLQDISSLSGLFPESYWISDVTKGKKISVGGEATVYLGEHRGEAIAIREFHPLESSGLGALDIGQKVRLLHCTVCLPVMSVFKTMIREIIAHWQLRHPNIVAVLGIHQFEEGYFPSMILQLADHSSAINYLELHPDSRSFLKLVSFIFAVLYFV